MPTTRPRHMITESDAISELLDLAAKRWPELRESPGDLLRKLIELGATTLRAESKSDLEKRLKALEELTELATGLWPADWIEKRKAEWPE